jgi:23S rRNA pseudouridine1911/1915/1917 synthase
MQNDNSKLKIIVTDLKTRLDKFLAEQMKDVSRSQIQRDIAAGQVLVNGQKVAVSHFMVRRGDRVNYNHNDNNNEDSLKPVNLPLKVLYDDHGLLIIDKPAGLVMHPGAGFKGTTLASALLYQFKDLRLVGEEERPGIVHRLDKDTSGVVLVAKTPEMYGYLKDAFAEKKIKKEYVALVRGRVASKHGFIDTPIGKSQRDFRKYDVKDIIRSKEALTEYWVLEYLSAENQKIRKSENQISPTSDISDSSGIDTYTLLRVKLHTGRTHQIRVHFNSLGHPVVGDALYGGTLSVPKSHVKRGGRRSRLEGLDRQFLHAKKIEVRLPDGTWIEAESELPEDLKQVLVDLNSKLVNQL